MSEIIYAISFVLLFYVYVGYYLLLKILSVIFGTKRNYNDKTIMNYLPSVTVIIAAYNEEKNLEKRLENLLSQDYLGEKEFIVASDGSTDRTVAIARGYTEKGIKVFAFEKNRGKAEVHNDAIAKAKGEIIISTDAETEFALDFMREITKPFSDPRVGCAVGRLYFMGKDSAIHQAEGFYWRWEVKTRLLQDKLGLLMTGSGACTAFRKELFTPLRPVDDIDFATTLDVIEAGKVIRYVRCAKAYDIAPSSLAQELGGRVRSSKRLLGTLTRWKLKQWLKHPLYSWTFISHKLLRWLSPIFIGFMAVTSILLAGRPLFNLSLVCFAAAGLLAGIGAWGHARKKTFPLASAIFAFTVANWGFFLGLVRLFSGRVPKKYKMPVS